MKILVAALTLILLCVGCHQYSPDLNVEAANAKAANRPKLIQPKDVVGCYRLELSSWKPRKDLGADAKYITPPKSIQIMADLGTEGFEKEGYLLRPAPGVDASIHRFSFWEPTGPEKIYLAWTTGFSGLTMDLEKRGLDLQGVAHTFWDFTRDTQTATVTAHRFDCGNK